MSVPPGRAADAGATERSRLLRDASGYMTAVYVSQLLAFGVGFVTKGLLGPVDLGTWSLLLAMLASLGLLDLGVVQAANKEIAYAQSKGDAKGAEDIKRVQYSFVVLTALLGSLGVLIYAASLPDGSSDALTTGLLCVALVLPVSQVHMGQVSVFWAHSKFSATGLLIVFEAALAGTLGLCLVWAYGVIGQIAAFALILLVKVAVLCRRAGDDPRLTIAFAWKTPIVKHLLRIGLPLQIINLANVFKISGTVFLTSFFFDTRAVGFFALALSFQNFIYWTPNAFSVVMFPRFQARYGSSDDQVTALHPYLIKPLYGLGFFLLPILLSATFFMVPPLIGHALPAYVPATALVIAMLPGTFFMSMEHMPGQLLITTNRLWLRVGVAMVNVALVAVCVAVAAALDASLTGFVVALSVSSALAFFFLYLCASRVAKLPPSARGLVARLTGAFLYTMAVMVTIDHVLPPSSTTWARDLAVAFGKWMLSLALLTPLLLVAQRQLGLVAAIRDVVRPVLRTRR